MANNTQHTQRDARVAAAIYACCHGAELRQCHRTEGQAPNEEIFVAIWDGGEEWGTHRVCIQGDAQLVVWGHYFRGSTMVEDAYKDYHKRIGAGI